jgi:hypothetical protein
MASVGRLGRALLLGLLSPLAGCSAARPEWLQQEDDACFRQRGFTEEIPRYYWGDPVHDPCWRFRPILGDR